MYLRIEPKDKMWLPENAASLCTYACTHTKKRLPQINKNTNDHNNNNKTHKQTNKQLCIAAQVQHLKLELLA